MTLATAIKHCLNPDCGKELHLRKATENGSKFDESMTDFRRRATCNIDCQRAYARYLRSKQHEEYITRKRAEYPEKYCAYSQCGKRLIPRDQETLKAFTSRITCDVNCSGARQRELADEGKRRNLNGTDLVIGNGPSMKGAKKGSIWRPSDEEMEAFMLKLERMYT